MKLPQAMYETIRWVIAVVIPATEVLLTTLTAAWAWNIPVDAINATLSGVALFLGVIFGISKLSNDAIIKNK